MERVKAALYGRLSKEDVCKIKEGDDSQSIINQRLLLTSYAIEHDFEIVDWYYDDDYSGLYSDRPGFQKLIEDAKVKKFDVVIAKSQSRFTRNMEHLEKYLHTMFPIWGIRFIGVVDNADTSIASNKKARQINGLINEWYCEDLSENIKSVFKAKMKDGQYIAAHPPYGYIKNPENTHKLIVDEYAAGIVKKIYQMYVSGMGKGAIGAQLTKEGVLIPSEYKKQVLKMNYHNANEAIYSKLWSYQTIHTILNDETYTGTMVQSKFASISYKSKKKRKLPPEEWIKIPNSHEAIISKELWETTQRLQKQRTRSVNNTKKIGLFGGILKCAECNKPLARAYNRRTHEFEGYCCSTYKKFGNTFCTQHKINNKELESVVLQCIKDEAKKILTSDDIAELRDFDITQSTVKTEKTTIEIIQQNIEKIEKYLKKAYEDYIDGVLTKEEYIDLKSRYKEEKEEYQGQIVELNKKIQGNNLLCKEQKQWIERLKNYIDIQELNREIVVELIDKIIVENNGGIRIIFRFSNLINA